MNIYEIDEPKAGAESFSVLYQNENLKIEAIRSRLTFAGTVYDQEEDEWVILIQGSAKLEIEGEVRTLRKGDSLFIARHMRHRVLSTSDDALWIGVFSS